MPVEDELACGVEHVGVRDAAAVYRATESAFCDGVAELILFHDGFDVFVAGILALRADENRISFVAFRELLDVWKTGDARAAADSPFFDDDGLVASVGKAHGWAGDDFADGEIGQLGVGYSVFLVGGKCDGAKGDGGE